MPQPKSCRSAAGITGFLSVYDLLINVNAAVESPIKKMWLEAPAQRSTISERTRLKDSFALWKAALLARGGLRPSAHQKVFLSLL